MNTDALNRRQFAAQTSVIGVATTLAAPAIMAQSGTSAKDQIQPVGGTTVKGTTKDAPPLAPPDKQPPGLKLPKVVDKKVGYAIVGLGQLSIDEILPAFAQCEYSQPTALVSGHRDKAETVAAAYGIADDAIYDYTSYDQLASDKRVDAIYIVLPNSMHAEYTLRGFKAGKHVLCEKPMAASLNECEQMIAAAAQADQKLMIAYRLHYEPFNKTVIEMCQQKKYGEIKTFSGSFCINVDAPNIRLSRALAGGPVGDVGVYPINAARYVTGEEPVEVTAQVHQPADDPRFREVPESVSILLKFPSGILANLDCSFGTHRSDFYRVVCEKGVIELTPAFSYRGQVLRTHEPSPNGDGLVVIDHEITAKNHFAAEMDHFATCILDSKDPDTPGAEGLADMKIMAAIDRSIRSGKTEKI